jgi:hypothetical protein
MKIYCIKDRSGRARATKLALERRNLASTSGIWSHLNRGLRLKAKPTVTMFAISMATLAIYCSFYLQSNNSDELFETTLKKDKLMLF